MCRMNRALGAYDHAAVSKVIWDDSILISALTQSQHYEHSVVVAIFIVG